MQAVKGFRQGRPSDWDEELRNRIAHHRHGFAEKEYLDLVTSFGQGVAVQEGERRLRRIVRAPRALDQHPAHSAPPPKQYTPFEYLPLVQPGTQCAINA